MGQTYDVSSSRGRPSDTPPFPTSFFFPYLFQSFAFGAFYTVFLFLFRKYFSHGFIFSLICLALQVTCSIYTTDILVLDYITSFEFCSMAATGFQEATSSTSPYQVFLIYRGKDTRKSFTDHLYRALDCAGFHTFRDDDGIEWGENIKSELQKAIKESRISIVVLSKTYASSSWCLDELVMILKRRSYPAHVVLPVFYDVDPSQVRKQMGSFKEAFTLHERKIEAESGERRKELMSKVEEWKAALRRVADLPGMNLQNTADGHEARFIQKIVKVVGDKISRTILDIAPHPIGIRSRAREIQSWLEDVSDDVAVAAICGMGGIGKTTIAKFLYNLNFSRFEGSSFLGNIREISQLPDGLLRLQKQLLKDILKGRKEKIYNVDEGIVKIKNALCFKRVLVILDDVDKLDQLDAVLGMGGWLFPGSKIIITTRHERLLRAHEVCKVYRIGKLDDYESLKLFSLHAFGQNHPIDDYVDISKLVVQHCEGLPLAIEILGSSLSGKSVKIWQAQLEKLKAITNIEIVEKLKISYDSLQDDHDRSLFLHLACFFVGSDKDYIVTIMDGCEFNTRVGIQNLIDRCLVTVDGSNKVVMHPLLQQMGREIVRQESPMEPGGRSRLWNHKDSFNVLRQNTGTERIEGLILDMNLLKEDKFARTVFGVNRKRSFEEILDNSVMSNVRNSLKRYCLGIFSQNSVGIAPAYSNEIALEINAFAQMYNLKLLWLNHVQIIGSFEHFPKKLRWLSWHGFPFESIPSCFPLEALVALEMPYSSLKHFGNRTKFLELLKILNLSHSRSLVKTPDFVVLPNLERLVLEDCTSLVEIHESIGNLGRLVLLNLKDCINLMKLPGSIGMLNSLGTLDISGCSNLETLPTEMWNMDSLTVLGAKNVTCITRSPATIQNVKAWRNQRGGSVSKSPNPDERNTCPTCKASTHWQTEIVGHLHKPNEDPPDFFDGLKFWNAESSIAWPLKMPSHDACAGNNRDKFSFSSLLKESEASCSYKGAFQQKDQLMLSFAYPNRNALACAPPRIASTGMVSVNMGSSDLASRVEARLEWHGAGSSYGTVPTIPDTGPTIPDIMPPLIAPQDTRLVTIKATYKNFTIKFKLPLTAGITELKEKVAMRLKLELDSFEVEYKDEDGDWILIPCDEDLRDYMQLCSSFVNPVIRLLVVDKVVNAN